MTKEQLKALGKRLIDTAENIYSVGAEMGLEISDRTFDQLRRSENMFRCEECNLWLSLAAEDGTGSDLCCDCAIERYE